MVPGVLENVAGMGGHQRDGLRDVERRAAAQSDHGVGAVGLVRGDTLAHLAPHRIAPDSGKDRGIEAR